MLKKHAVSLYYFAFAQYCFIYWLNTTTYNRLPYLHIHTLYVLARILCLALLFIKIILDKLPLKVYLVYAFLFLVFLASALQSGSWNLFLLSLFVLAGSGVKIEKMAKIVLCSTTVVACCAVAGSLLGLIYMRMLPSGDTFRPSYGFVHPNQFGLCLLTICISVAVYRFRKFRFIEIGIGLICFILAYFFAVSRTSSICILLTIALAVVCTLDKEGKLDRLILRCGMAILAVLQFASLYLMMFYDSGSQWMVRLDGLLSNRLVLMHHFYTDYPHSLFGHNFDSIEHTWFSYYEGFIVDNGFAHAFLESGAIVEFIIFLCWFAVLWKACRLRKLEASGLGLLLFGIAAFTEASAFYIVVNFCLVAANNLIKTERELV